jgi:hypothetical protein
MELTFVQLQEAHKKRLLEDKGDLPIQVLRNHLSVLNSYLAFCGKTTENMVGREFTIDFTKKSADFIKLVCPGNKKTASDKMSILRAWYKTVSKLNKIERLKPPTGVSLFHQELRIAIAKTGESIPAIAKAINGMPETVRKWVNGAYPFKKGLPTFRRLEAYLGFERGYLENMLGYPRKAVNVTTPQGGDKFMARLRENVKDTYYLRYDAMLDELKAEWQKFMKYKTAEFPVGLKRTSRGRWRAIPDEAASVTTQKNPLCRLGANLVIPTAERTIAMLRSYFGFLSKPATDEKFPGLGLPQDGIQTLAIFVIPEFVNAYMEFVKTRSGNITHAGQNNFGGFVASLTRKIEGYLRQHPQFFEKIERFANGRTWDELCDETHATSPRFQ